AAATPGLGRRPGRRRRRRAAAVVPSRPELVYLGHDSGHVSVWETAPKQPSSSPAAGGPNDFGRAHEAADDAIRFRKIVKLSNYQITAMEGVTKYLWVGFRTGTVFVYEPEIHPEPARSSLAPTSPVPPRTLGPQRPPPLDPARSWKVLKVWQAHKEAVLKIIVDPSLLWDEVGKLHVATTSTDWRVKLWDGTMSVDWLAAEMRKRQSEYCTYRPITALLCSWNVDACKPNDLAGTCDNLNFLEDVLRSAGPSTPEKSHNDQRPSASTPDLIVFGFQEMIDLENKKLTAKTVLLGGRKKAAGTEKLSDSVSQVYRKWHDKLVATVRTFMPPDDPYVVIHTENLVGLFTCVFVKSSERAKMRDIAVTTVKTGMKGRYGNKGAILARLVIDDSSICFINCHLAAGQKHVRQRNSDLIDILEEKSFFPDAPDRPASSQPAPCSSTAGELGGCSEVYVGGGTGAAIADHEICFLQGDLNYRIDADRDTVIRAIAAGHHRQLLAFDQLLLEKSRNPLFRLRAFNEPPIRFHPTYKYDPGTHMYDSSEKARVPAWCDRILYRTPTEDSDTLSPPTLYIQAAAPGSPRPAPSFPVPSPLLAPPSAAEDPGPIVVPLDYRRYRGQHLRPSPRLRRLPRPRQGRRPRP
ncbi:hypothetical protein PTTG_02032, partial [Puccinia triticina 1-1 BBBD Race 1]